MARFGERRRLIEHGRCGERQWFRSDAASTADFVGSSCGFCGQTSNATNPYDYGANSMLESK